MKHMKTILIALLIIIIIGVITFAVSKNKNREQISEREQLLQAEDELPEFTLNVKHQYKDDTHSFAGSIETPTPCYDVFAMVIPGDSPEIQITTEEQRDVMCAQVITEHDFLVTYRGDANIEFIATLNGEPVYLNRFEIDPSEDIESFEIFIKG